MFILAALTACSADRCTGDAVEEEVGRVTIDWGVEEACSSVAAPGLGAWDGAILLHGDSVRDAAFGAQVVTWYPDMEPRRWSDLSSADRERDLFIVGYPNALPILEEMNGTLPVWFDPEGFTFGGYRYDEPGNGIVLVHPSPFSAGRLIRLHVGNSYAGAWSTFSIQTGSRDYNTTRGRNTVMQEGSLCRSGDRWGFVPDRDADYRPAWETWVAGLEVAHSEHHSFYYLSDSAAAAGIERLLRWQEEQYGAALDMLGLAPVEYPIRWYLYPDNETKGRITGRDGNAHANMLNFEVHAVYSEDLQAVGAHEDVHVVAWHQIGEATSVLLGEGIAVMVSGEWWGEPLAEVVAGHRSAGTLPTLRILIDDFWSLPETTSYPVAGHLVAWLIAEYGLDRVKALYMAVDLDAAFASELGRDTAQLESDWLATIE
jgi:hypothetical protein